MITRMTKYWLAALALLALNTSLATAQYANPATPIVFNGTSIDVGALYPNTTTNAPPALFNPVQVTGGGTLTDGLQKVIAFEGNFTGSGQLVVATGPNNWVELGYDTSNTPLVPQGYPMGLNLQSSPILCPYTATTLNGPLFISGTSALIGNITVTSNIVNGTTGSTLSLDYLSGSYFANVLTFSGASPGFVMNSTIDPNQPSSDIVGSYVVLTNTSGTQTFGGTIGDKLYRVGEGGSTAFTAALAGGTYIEGGTAILSGPNGTVTGPVLQGGTLVMDNTSANNNNRLTTGALNFNGGNLTLLGLNVGATNEYNNFPRGTNQTTGPVFNLGLNVFTVQAGTGGSSYASYTFGGIPTSYDGSVDFEKLSTTSQVFFNSMSAGPIAPWATFGGTDFAAYDTTNGVVALATTGRPSQVSAGTVGSYVLGTTPQSALTGSVSVYGVTMNVGTALDLGGNNLSLDAWIQNTGLATISSGTLSSVGIFENDHYFGDLIFTTNANTGVTVSTGISAGCILKNGTGTLTISGSAYGTQGQNSGYPKIYVDQGTLNLGLTVPMASGQQYLGYPTVIVGQAAGTTGSAVLAFQAGNMFGGSGSTAVGIQVLQAGQINCNGFAATLQYLEVDGGTVNQGNGYIYTPSITANPLGGAGQITGGAVSLTGTTPTITVNPLYPNYGFVTSADGLVISSQVLSNAALTKAGSGVLVLAATGNFFGNGTVGLILSNGTVALRNSNSAGSANQQIQITNSAALEAETTGTLVLTNPVTVGPASFYGSDMVLSHGVAQTAHGEIAVANTTTIVGYSNSLAYGNGVADGKTGSGTLVLSGTAMGTSTGTFNAADGVLAFDSDTPLPPNMTIGFTGGTLEAVNAPHTVSNALNIVGDLNFAGSQPLTFSASVGNVLGLHVTRAIYTNDTQPVTINNLNAQQSTLITGGPGTLVLAGNPFSLLATVITGGTLELASAPSAGAALGQVTVSPGATWNLNNSNATASVLSGTGTVSLGTGTLTAMSGTFTGTINGAGAFIKSGTTVLQLSGTLAYTGPTSVTAGGLILNTSLTSTSSVSISSGATLTVASGTLSPTGNLVNTGTLALAGGTSAAAGGTFTNNGTLDLRNDPNYVLPANFVNNGTVLVAPPATDTPTMPAWALILTAALLGIAAVRQMSPTSSRPT